MLLFLCLIILLIFSLFKLNQKRYVLAFFSPRIRSFNGAKVDIIAPTVPGKTIFGNTFDVVGLSEAETFLYHRRNSAMMEKSYITYMFGFTIYNVIDPVDAEMFFTDPNLITKSKAYDLIKPILGEGLLISTNRKWHDRRKLLTPAFHFNILTEFEGIFKEESKKFVTYLQTLNLDCVAVSDIIPKLTLNIICETALGIKLDDCLNGNEYRESVKMFEASFNKRLGHPVLFFDRMYKIFAESKCEPLIKIAHAFSSDIIKRRRVTFARDMRHIKTAEDFGANFQKKRYALLDILLLAERNGHIDHTGICEEVDTFMFEGFDTTSMALIFSLMNLSLYPEQQERCYQEIIKNIDQDLKALDIRQLNNLKYLECFIKETLRLYPSVPEIGREIIEETKLSNGLILPPGTQILIHIFDLHRNKKYFSNPDAFQPERFFNNDNIANKQPFAFAPFSAGQRNCIGQKFAMLEMKTLLVYIIKYFKLSPLMDPETFQFEIGIILRTKNKINVKFERRVEKINF